MAKKTDVFYGFCTFWTGDWVWLAEKNGARVARDFNEFPPPVMEALAEKGITIQRKPRPVKPPSIPHCPFCGSVGFEMPREDWLKEAREWEDGTSPIAKGVPHPGYGAMLLWGEKKCFPTYTMLETAWRMTLEA